MAKIVKFLIGILFVFLGECLDIIRLMFFKDMRFHEMSWFRNFIKIAKWRMESFSNWIYWFLGAILLGPWYLGISIVQFVISAFAYAFRIPLMWVKHKLFPA